MMNKSRTMMATLLAVSAVLSPVGALAQANGAAPLRSLATLAYTDHFLLESEEIGRAFHIFVRKPEGYDAAPEKFPTVYALDGDVTFPMLAAYHLLLAIDTDVPEALIVGIGYGTLDPEKGNYRSYDFSTPPFGPDFGLGGAEDETQGAAAFHAFLTDTLIPKIERDYEADPARRILIGQSRGAHFVLYSAYNAPEAFWGRIAINPSLVPNRERFFRSFEAASMTDARLFFASSENDWPRLRKDALALFDHLDAQETPPWRLETVSVPGGTHAANYVDIYREGMKWLFGVKTAATPNETDDH
ncbi:MAG: alpha/beta hydrolase-fold protein [Pseudomonadota bacterium]